MSLSSECSSLAPVQSNYVARGEFVEDAGLPIYLAQSVVEKPELVIIVCYDIFGLHPNNLCVADTLASSSQLVEKKALVVIPDVLRGKPWSFEHIPMKPEHKFMEWAGERSFEKLWKNDINTTIKYIRSRFPTVISFANVGFCWGASMAIQSASLESHCVRGSAIVHPSPLKEEHFLNSLAPICALPAQTDADLAPFMKLLENKAFFSKCYHERFDDCIHGWVGARGDFSDPTKARRAMDAIAILVKFFHSL